MSRSDPMRSLTVTGFLGSVVFLLVACALAITTSPARGQEKSLARRVNDSVERGVEWLYPVNNRILLIR